MKKTTKISLLALLLGCNIFTQTKYDPIDHALSGIGFTLLSSITAIITYHATKQALKERKAYEKKTWYKLTYPLSHIVVCADAALSGSIYYKIADETKYGNLDDFIRYANADEIGSAAVTLGLTVGFGFATAKHVVYKNLDKYIIQKLKKLLS